MFVFWLGALLGFRIGLVDLTGKKMNITVPDLKDEFVLQLESLHNSQKLPHAIKRIEQIINGHFVVEASDIIKFPCLFVLKDRNKTTSS